jgi:signal transduction histidine kinase
LAARPSRPFATWATRFTLRDHWPELAWGLFAIANAGLMLALPEWQTVPFHFVWVSLTVLYGYRLWRRETTTLLLTAVVLATGAAILAGGEPGHERLSELTEVPLMAAMFMAMVWHARRRYEALRQVRRAAERERDFVRDASHQLRTPITIARGHAELIRCASADPQIVRDAEVVIGELHRLGRASDRLLILAASEHPGFLVLQPVELAELVRLAASRWCAIPGRRWRFLADAPGTLLVDRERIDCVLDALIENAIKATDAGDRIAVEARADGPVPVLAVSDDGRGMKPGQVARVFERFARVPDEHGRCNGGTGLGLPIVKAIIEAHHGTVSVASEVGVGTAFELRFREFVPARRTAGVPGPVAAR